MRIVQSVSGAFHHVDLANQLVRHGLLERIFSTFPWRRLAREGVPRELVSTFPWIHTPYMLWGHARWVPSGLRAGVSKLNQRTFDQWVSKRLPPADALIALSGSGLRSGIAAQRQGTRYICDRGSSHIRFQRDILEDEYRRWGVAKEPVDPWVIAQEESEYDAADAITIPSTFCQRSFLAMGIPAEKLNIVPYGVRLDRFHPVAEPSATEFRVLFVGQVSLRKGVPYLLEAFRKLRHPAKRLRIIGAVADDLRPVLAKADLNQVEFVGRLPQACLNEEMSAAHVMVLPSIEEGLALVQGQAMACGCPLISSRNTGAEDLFSDGKEGFIVEPRSSPAIAGKLQHLADAPDVRGRMAEAALARVRSLGGWDDYGDRMLKVVSRVIEYPVHATLH